MIFIIEHCAYFFQQTVHFTCIVTGPALRSPREGTGGTDSLPKANTRKFRLNLRKLWTSRYRRISSVSRCETEASTPFVCEPRLWARLPHRADHHEAINLSACSKNQSGWSSATGLNGQRSSPALYKALQRPQPPHREDHGRNAQVLRYITQRLTCWVNRGILIPSSY